MKVVFSYLLQIADFGLSKNLDSECYVSDGGLVPIKWTAPEVEWTAVQCL